MATELNLVGDKLAELENAFFDIPFENSMYQNLAFVLAAAHTPARAYRSLGLKMISKIKAIEELKFARKLEAINIEEKQAILSGSLLKSDGTQYSEFDKRRAEVEIERSQTANRHTDKLLNDAIIELNYLYEIFKEFPRYTREQFESEEELHFHLKLDTQIKSAQIGGSAAGSIESKINMEEAQRFKQLLKHVRDGKALPQFFEQLKLEHQNDV